MTMWHSIDAQFAFRIWHWTFLALPAPFPEEMIGRDPVAFWNRMSDARHRGEIAHIRSAHDCALSRIFKGPLRIHATCEDYRAGRTTDLKNDEADRAAGKKITCPLSPCGARRASRAR